MRACVRACVRVCVCVCVFRNGFLRLDNRQTVKIASNRKNEKVKTWHLTLGSGDRAIGYRTFSMGVKQQILLSLLFVFTYSLISAFTSLWTLWLLCQLYNYQLSPRRFVSYYIVLDTDTLPYVLLPTPCV